MPTDITLTLTDDEMNALRMWREGDAKPGAFSAAWTSKLAQLIPTRITIEIPAHLATLDEFSAAPDPVAYPAGEDLQLSETEAMVLRSVRAAVRAMGADR